MMGVVQIKGGGGILKSLPKMEHVQILFFKYHSFFKDCKHLEKMLDTFIILILRSPFCPPSNLLSYTGQKVKQGHKFH